MIEVRFARRVPGISGAWVRKMVRAALETEKSKGRDVSVLVTGDTEIRKINKRHLNHDYATDVISFSAGEGPFLGDVVVSAQTARAAAAELGIPFKEELARYLVHGTLHLLGHRDKKPGERKRMHRRQELILKKVL